MHVLLHFPKFRLTIVPLFSLEAVPMMTEYDTVLLAEDDENDVLLFQTAFKKVGVPKLLVCVPDGEDAIKYLKGTGIYSNRIQYPLPCLLITDLKMARRTGFDLLEWVQTQTQFTCLPTIVLSSSVEESDKRRASKLGAQAFWVKPAHFEELVDLVCLLKEKWLTPHHEPANLSSIQNRLP